MSRADDLLWRRWNEVDPLLEAALELPPEERAAYVTRATAADESLRELVLRLLDRIASEQRGVTTPPHEVVVAAFGAGGEAGAEADLEPGTQVGRYLVGPRRGRGGMATVYEAERSDGAYKQRVALKVLRRGLDTEDLVRRFVTERQILSSLSHPNIARLLDGGSTPDGRPYLVMELVEGEPITSYADAHRLGIAARLELVLGVADAVSTAHRQLVVHRDIKPSNILVDGEGRVRLLDFGIAKLLVGDSQATDVGLRVLTPDYASPEQLRGEAITTATDVYQLGLLLRKLLGERLAGEPAIIVGKALRTQPEERYPTAEAFGADIRRYLAGMPILAHPESVGYRLRKFLGRHPAALPGAAAVALALAGFIGALTWQNRRLERERDVTAAALRRAQETQAFFVDLFRSPDPWSPADSVRGRNITVLEALRLGARRVREELVGQPALRAALLSTIGGVLLSLDQLGEARATLEEAVSLRTPDAASTEELSDDLGRLGRSLDGLNARDSARVVLTRRLTLERRRVPVDSARLSRALRDLATTYYHSGPLERAIALLEEAADVLRGGDPEDRAAALIQLADGYRMVDRLVDSEAAAHEALRLTELRVGRDDPATAAAAYTLAKTLGMRGRFEDASALFSPALAVLDRSLGSDHAYTIDVRSDFGYLLVRAEEYSRAETVFRGLLETKRRKYGGDNHSTVATALQNLAGALLGQGRYGAAERLTWQAESIYRRTMPPSSFIVAYPMLTRSEIQLAREDYAGAARTAKAAATLLRGLVPATHPAAIVADCRLGRARAGLGRLVDAKRLLVSVGERLGAEGLREVHRAECRAALGTVAGVVDETPEADGALRPPATGLP